MLTLLLSQFITEGSQAAAQSRNPEVEAWKQELIGRGRGGMVFSILLFMAAHPGSYRTEDHQPRRDITYSELDRHHQSLIKKILYRLAYSLILMELFFSLENLSSQITFQGVI